jgi:protoporphyrinogen oxidase
MRKEQTKQRWAVVGGGFLGMTLAMRLAQQGKGVTLYEAAPNLGGLAASWQLGDVVWDRHYHVILASDTHLRALLAEIDLEKDLRWCRARTGIYLDSKLHSISSAIEFLLFPGLNLIDKLRLALTILRASRIKDGRALEGIAVEDWVAGLSGSKVTEKIWLPLLRAKLGESYRDTSAAFLWATIARMYGARRTGTKAEEFGYVRGGYARIVRHMERELEHEGVQCVLGQPVREVTTRDANGLRIELQNGAQQDFDQVVVTTAAPLAARICPELTSEEKAGLDGVRYQGIICASILLKRPLAGFYITNIADERAPFTAVIEMSAIVDQENFGGRSLLYLPKYVSSDSPEFKVSEELIQESFLAALERMYPGFKREDVLCFQVSRVRHVFPIPTLHYSDRLPQASTSVSGLHIVNSSQIVNGTLNVNETVLLAEVAAQRFAQQSMPVAISHEPIVHELAEANR